MVEMRAISLWQPWASLLFTPAKRHETRSWAPPRTVWGQRIAIHAAKKEVPPVDTEHLMHILQRELEANRLPTLHARGAIIGTAVLKSHHRMTDVDMFRWSDDELDTGDWTPGRWAWELTDHELFIEPIPWKGAQGFFKVEVPNG